MALVRIIAIILAVVPITSREIADEAFNQSLETNGAEGLILDQSFDEPPISVPVTLDPASAEGFDPDDGHHRGGAGSTGSADLSGGPAPAGDFQTHKTESLPQNDGNHDLASPQSANTSTSTETADGACSPLLETNGAEDLSPELTSSKSATRDNVHLDDVDSEDDHHKHGGGSTGDASPTTEVRTECVIRINEEVDLARPSSPNVEISAASGNSLPTLTNGRASYPPSGRPLSTNSNTETPGAGTSSSLTPTNSNTENQGIEGDNFFTLPYTILGLTFLAAVALMIFRDQLRGNSSLSSSPSPSLSSFPAPLIIIWQAMIWSFTFSGTAILLQRLEGHSTVAFLSLHLGVLLFAVGFYTMLDPFVDEGFSWSLRAAACFLFLVFVYYVFVKYNTPWS